MTGGVEVGMIGGVGATYAGGFGETKGSWTGGGDAAALSIDRGNPLAGPTVPEVRGAILGLLNQFVNPAPGDSFPAMPAAGDGSCGRGELNMAVNSPTGFRAGSTCCCGNSAGTSDGVSGRNGPRKKFVNSPGLGPSLRGDELGSEGNLGGLKAELNESSGLLMFGAGFAGTEIGEGAAFHSGAGRTPERSVAGLGVGKGAVGCSGAFAGTLEATGFAGGSKPRRDAGIESGLGADPSDAASAVGDSLSGVGLDGGAAISWVSRACDLYSCTHLLSAASAGILVTR